MVADGITVAVAAALILGAYIVGIKEYFNDFPPTAFVAVSYAVGAVWYLPVVVHQTTSSEFQRTITTHGIFLVVIAALTAAALVSFYASLARGDVSYVAPLSKTVPAFVLPIEVLVLGQSITGLQVLGIAIVTAAVYIINYRGDSIVMPIVRLFGSKAAGLALASAILFAIVDVGKRVSMQEFAIPTEVFVFVTLVFVAVLLSPFVYRTLDVTKLRDNQWPLLAAGGTLSLGQHLVATAFETLPASVASPIVNTQAVVAVFLGGFLLGEADRSTRMAAVVLATVGIVTLSIGRPG